MNVENSIYKSDLNKRNEKVEELYMKYKNKIKYFIYNIIKDYEKAEDITQEVFIYIMESNYEKNVNFKQYIYLIAKSRAISYLNVKKRRNEIIEKYNLNKEIQESKDLLNIIIEQENKNIVLKLINELDDKYRNAMYLVKIEGLSYKDVAKILGENVQNIKNYIHRGKKILKKSIEKEQLKETRKFTKIVIIFIGITIIYSSMVFAKDIKEFIDDIIINIFGNTNEGMTTAIENDYNININMEYLESNNVKLKIDQIMLDEFNLGVVCKIELNDNKNLDNIHQIDFKNILIINEKNDVLYANYKEKDKLEEYCNLNNLDSGVFGIGASDGSYTGKIINKENNRLVYSFSTASEKFPNSEKLFIKIEDIYLINLIDNSERIIKGNWEFNIDMKELEDKRELIQYSVIDINDDKTIVVKAELSMANMRLELITDSDKIDFKKMQNRDRNTMNVIEMLPFHEMYIENENGKKFFQTSTGGNGYTTIENNKIHYYVTFNYTYFDKTSKIKIVLPTNKRENIIIEMQY